MSRRLLDLSRLLQLRERRCDLAAQALADAGHAVREAQRRLSLREARIAELTSRTAHLERSFHAAQDGRVIAAALAAKAELAARRRAELSARQAELDALRGAEAARREAAAVFAKAHARREANQTALDLARRTDQRAQLARAERELDDAARPQAPGVC